MLSRSPHNHAPARIGAMLVMTCALIGGCDRSSPQAKQTQLPAPAIDRTYSAGAGRAGTDTPLRVHLRVDRDHITTADRVTLNLELSTADGVEINWPEPTDALGDFQIAGKNSQPAPAETTGRATDFTLVLEPFLNGTKKIPAFEFRYRAGQSRDWKTLKTEPITIEVSSVLPADTKDAALSPAKAPMALVFGPGWMRWAIGAAASALALAYPAAFIAARVRSRRLNSRLDPIAQARADLAGVRSQLTVVERSFGQPDPAHAATLARIGRVGLSAILAEDVRGRLADEISLASSAAIVDRTLLTTSIETLRALDQQRFAPTGLSVIELTRHADVMDQLLHAAAQPRERGKEVAA